MVNFTRLQKEIKEYDALREDVIKKSRDVLKLSKLVIYAVHRDEISNASKLVTEMKKEKKVMDTIAAKKKKLRFEGSYKVAVQEYVEAVLYYTFVKTGKLIDITVDANHFIGGLADLPGELVRKAVYLAGKGKVKEVVEIKDAVDEIYGKLLTFDLRENELRKKVDGVKYDLRKLEDLVLDLKLKKR